MRSLLGVTLAFFVSISFAKNIKKTPISKIENAERYSEETLQCLSCHMNAKAFVYYDWKNSKHAMKGVGCYECHRSDIKDPSSFMHYGFRISTLVTPRKCARCHKNEVKEHLSSLHGKAYFTLSYNQITKSYYLYLLKLMGYGKYTKLPYYKLLIKKNPSTEVIFLPRSLKRKKLSKYTLASLFNNHSCLKCHGSKVRVCKKFVNKVFLSPLGFPNEGVGRINPDGSVGSCANCHPFHSFSIKVARSPESCGVCHKYTYESYKHSFHYVLYKNLSKNLDKKNLIPGKDYRGPSCASCHMGAIYEDDLHTLKYPSTHNVSRLSAWKLLYGVPRKKNMKINKTLSKTYYIKAGKKEAIISSKPLRYSRSLNMTYNLSFIEARKVAMALCEECHTRAWTANYFATLDELTASISKLQKFLLALEKALKKKKVYTAYDYIMIRNLYLKLSRKVTIPAFHENYASFQSLDKFTLELNKYLNNVKRRLGLRTYLSLKRKYLN